MPIPLNSREESSALIDLRRRGQFLISGLLWAATAGFSLVLSGYVLVVYHYGLALAERLRASFGLEPPRSGPDWFMLAMLACGPSGLLIGLIALWTWYTRLWFRKLASVWPDRRLRSRHAKWRTLPVRASAEQRNSCDEYISALLDSEIWSAASETPDSGVPYEAKAEWALGELDRGI